MLETTAQIVASMHQRLTGLVPEIEYQHQAELIAEIQALKEEKNAVILGHNYMDPALYHFVADYRGDSLELARIAAKLDVPIIVFCGVEFMAETAKIVNPDKKVLIPSRKAGCSLAASITAEDVRQLKKLYPGVPVVTYVNCYADVKAETDICCTSSNAVQVVESLNTDRIIFLPDEYLARNVANETGISVIMPTKDPRSMQAEAGLEKVLIGWPGRCEVHDQFSVSDIENARRQFPDIVVLAHPECRPEVVDAADFSGSTSRMIDFVAKNPARRHLLLTECSMGDNIIAESRASNIVRLCSVRCPHMAQITLEQTRDALREEKYEITLDPDIITRARRALDRMLALKPA